MIVAVVDTGVDPAAVPFNLIPYGSGFLGWDFYNGDGSVYDDYLYDYHGTYIATTVARTAPEVSILPVKFMEGSHGGVQDAVKAIEYAAQNGARIINCSWSFDTYDDGLFEVIKSNPDVLFVCAAGNTNINTDKVEIYPCCYELDNVLSVMAMDSSGRPYGASGYGSGVDIAAPGENVRVFLPEFDVDYVDGTSVATAFVSAAAALIISLDEDVTPAQIRETIMGTARENEFLKDMCVSGGYLDISACLKGLKGGG